MSTEFKDFIGRVAFITGGASGIGEQVAQDLAEAGASVVIADRNLEAAQELVETLPTDDGQVHLAIELDVSVKAQVDDAADLVKKKYRRPADLIVNSAGIADGAAPLADLKEDDLDRVLNVNFKGTFLVTQAFGRALLDAGMPGSIVNLSSILAYSPWETMSHYCSSKAAVQQFTKVAAKEWGPRNIRVNSVHPGLTQSPLTAKTKDSPIWKLYEAKASLRRVGQPKG